jgi:hypothetical protein
MKDFRDVLYDTAYWTFSNFQVVCALWLVLTTDHAIIFHIPVVFESLGKISGNSFVIGLLGLRERVSTIKRWDAQSAPKGERGPLSLSHFCHSSC